MSPNRDSSSTILSSNVHMPTPPLKRFQEAFLYLQDQLYMIFVSGSGEAKMIIVKNINRRKALDVFHATDRTVNEDFTKYDCPHEVLELVLSDQHSMGGSFSKRYAALVECRDGLEVVLPPPLPKGAFGSLRDAFSYMKKVPPFDGYFKESGEDETETLLYRMVDSQAVEMLLCRDAYYETVTSQISVVGRRAERPEIMPYSVEFHYSQKYWYERLREWLVKTFQEQIVEQRGCSSSQRPSPFGCDPDGALMQSHSNGSMVSFVHHKSTSRRAKKKVPMEIKVASTEKPRSTRPTSPTGSLISRGEISIVSRGDNIWIAEKDIALGVHHGVHPDLKATTYANKVFERRVLPFYASKKTIRQSHIWVMKLMLQEELEDDEAIQVEARKGTTFWAKLSDCTDDEGRKASVSETKWLRKADGDFIGPFVKASDSTIYKGVVEWIAALGAEESSQPDPEPTSTRSFATAEQEETTQEASTAEEEETETSLARTSKPRKQAALTVMVPEQQKFPGVFNLTGPIETLDQQAKDVCQEWINNSDTLLIKAAKKSLIDSFQGDFHSFLFLFQLQLKRIKGGYSGNKQHAAQGGGADDASWVSADPSVQEEDTRIADIERACIGFMNQMGNTMVKRYQEMTGDTGPKPSPDQRDDDGADEEVQKINAGERQDGKKGVRQISSPKSVPRSRKGIREETSRIARRDSDDPAVIDKDDSTYEKTSYVSFSKSYDSSDASASATTPERWLKQVYDRKGRRSPHSRQVYQNKREALPRRGRSPRRYNEFESDEDEDTTTVRSYRSRSYEQSFENPSCTLSPSPSRSFDEQSPSRSFDEQSPSRSFTERSPSPDLSCSRRSRRHGYNSPPPSNTFTDDDTYPTSETGHLDSVSLAGSEISIEQAPSDENPQKETGWFGAGWL